MYSKWRRKMICLFFRLLAPIAPSLAVHAAYRLFHYPVGVMRRQSQEKPLPAPECFMIPMNDKRVLQGYRWGRKEAPTILLVHGWSTTYRSMSHLIEALISKGSQVITYDALRHGKSHAKRADLADWADSVQAVLQAIGDVDCIIAHSFGAAAVTVASRHGLATKRLIFIAPIHDIVSVSDHFGAELCISPDILKEMRQYTWEQNKERFEAYGKNWEEIFDSPFEVPTLICHDKNDKRIGIEHSLTLRKKWPWAQLIITEGLGHRKILDDARIIQQCCRFIETPL